MLRLIVSDVDLELYENAPVNLQFQYSDVEAINNPLGSYSQTFRVPLTVKNREVFGYIDEAGLEGGLDLRQRLTAQMLDDSTPILAGYVQVKGVYLTKEQYGEVELVFFSGAVDLKTELGGALLTDLNLSAYNHTLTSANIADSWLVSGSLSPEIRYMLMDKGSNWTSPTKPIGTTDAPLPLSVFNPSIQAKVLLDKIISTAGYTYESTYLDSADFEDIYMPCWNGSLTTVGETQDNENIRVAMSTSGQTFTGGGSNEANMNDFLTGCQDPGSNWLNTDDAYTAPFSGLYTLRWTYSWDFSGSSGNTAAVIGAYINNSIFDQFNLNFGGNRENQLYEVSNFYMTAGDELTIEIFNPNITGGSFLLLGSSNFNTGVRTTLEVIVESRLGDYTVDIGNNLPVMKQIDFLTTLQTMFNLVFVPDRSKPNHLVIDSYENYVASGPQRDWTNKVDYGKDVLIKPTTDIQFREYAWSYLPGLDFVNLQIQASLDRVYGRYRVIDNSNAFAIGEKKLTTSTAPFVVSLVPGTNIPMFRGLTQDGTGIQEPLPMLCYWNGIDSGLGSISVRIEDGTVVTLTTLPTFSTYSQLQPGITDNDLSFGVEQPFYSVPVTPRDTLYIRFWAEYVAELYSEDSRIIECSIRLNEADLASWSFADSIYIKDAFYRVLSIAYDANEPSVAKCTLIKKLDDIALCADLPTAFISSSNNNYIAFNNSAVDYGSQECCEFYGYVWDLNKVDPGATRCRPRNTGNTIL